MLSFLSKHQQSTVTSAISTIDEQTAKTFFDKNSEKSLDFESELKNPQKQSLWGTFIRDDTKPTHAQILEEATSSIASNNSSDPDETHKHSNTLFFEKMFPDLSTLDHSVQREIKADFERGNMNDAIMRYADALKTRQKEFEQKKVAAQNALQNIINKLDDIDIDSQKQRQQLARELELVKTKLNTEHKIKSLEIEITTLEKKINHYQEHIREIADIIDQSPIDLNKLIDQKKTLESELANLK